MNGKDRLWGVVVTIYLIFMSVISYAYMHQIQELQSHTTILDHKYNDLQYQLDVLLELQRNMK